MKDLKHLQRIIKDLQDNKDKGKLGDYAQGRLAAFKMAEPLVKKLSGKNRTDDKTKKSQ